MQMKNADLVRYSKFAYYVRVNLPQVADVPAIVQAFQKYGQINRTTLKRALKWGQGPEIKITQLKDDEGNDLYGEFTPDINSNEIRIDTDVVEEFEAGRGILKTKSGKDVYLAGVTLLHELIHWADDQDGIDWKGGVDDEEGAQFERDVYGQVIG